MKKFLPRPLIIIINYNEIIRKNWIRILIAKRFSCLMMLRMKFYFNGKKWYKYLWSTSRVFIIIPFVPKKQTANQMEKLYLGTPSHFTVKWESFKLIGTRAEQKKIFFTFDTHKKMPRSVLPQRFMAFFYFTAMNWRLFLYKII